MIQPVIGEDTCGCCGQPIRADDTVRRTTDARSVDQNRRIRYQWAHISCLNRPVVEPVDVGPPPHAEWVRLLASDPFTAGQKIWELEQRIAALERRR